MPLLADVVAAGRALRAADPGDRAALLERLIAEASAAELHGRKTGRNHPYFGDGSLMAASLAYPCAREPGLDDADYCLCLTQVLAALASRSDPGSGLSLRG